MDNKTKKYGLIGVLAAGLICCLVSVAPLLLGAASLGAVAVWFDLVLLPVLGLALLLAGWMIWRKRSS